MVPHRTFSTKVGMVAAALWMVAQVGVAAEEKSPEFLSETYYGGAGHQGANFSEWRPMGLATDGHALYLSALERAATTNHQALVLKYLLPPGASPAWVARWPNDQNIQRHYPLPGVAVAGDGVYLAGQGKSDTVNRYGVWGSTSALVKYPLGGPTGPAVGGASWVVRPVLFPEYNGTELLMDLIAVPEGGTTVLYAAGHAEAAEGNVTAMLAKFDLKGTRLWSKALGDVGPRRISHGVHIAALGSHLYVAGTINPTPIADNSNWRANLKPTLWKVDSAGNLLWTRMDTRSVVSRWSGAVASTGDAVVMATTLLPGADGNSDVLLVKYDEQGTLIWSKVWGTTKEDVVRDVAAAGTRVYLTGETRGWVGGGERDVFLAEVAASTGEVLSVLYHGGKFDERACRVLAMGADLYILGDSYSHTNFANLDVMLLRYALNRPPPVLTVAIDIKPGSEENPINPKAQGKIPVAILTTTAFNAPMAVNRATLTFGRTGDEQSVIAAMCKPEDVNGDGLLDLVFHAENPTAAFQAGDTRGILKGKTKDGRPFVGSDRVTIVPPAPPTVTPPKPAPPRVSPPAPPGVKPPPAQRGVSEAEAIKSLQREGGVAY